MKVKSENYTPRERVNREMLDRMLAENAREEAYEQRPLPHFTATTYPSMTTGACPCRDQKTYRRQSGECCPKCKDSREYRCDYSMDNKQSECKKDYVCQSPVYPGVSLAMVYSPCQSFDNLHDPEIGIDRGTIFKELDKPFMPTPCNERWCK